MKEFFDNVWNWMITEGIKALIVLVLFFIFCKIMNTIFKRLNHNLEKKGMDPTLREVLVPWSRRAVKFLAFMVVIGYLGFETSSISAVIVSLGATIGLALQGSLSNFAGGIVIIVMRPYKLGDFVEINGKSGTVSHISLFYTNLTTPDNKETIIPNSAASNTSIVNYSKNPTRRDDLVFSISYGEDFEKAKKVIIDVINNSDFILKDPAPFVNISEHGDSSINILARYWVNAENYWDAHWYMLEAVKKAFDENNISIPYPQLDVHFDKNNEITK